MPSSHDAFVKGWDLAPARGSDAKAGATVEVARRSLMAFHLECGSRRPPIEKRPAERQGVFPSGTRPAPCGKILYRV